MRSSSLASRYWSRPLSFVSRRRRPATKALSTRAKHSDADATKVSSVRISAGDAPFPLRLVYTYRSPGVKLHQGDSPRWPLTLLLGANLGVYCAWVWLPPDQDREAMKRSETYRGMLEWEAEQTELADAHADFMQRHFTVSLQNLVEGRLHTLVTAGFSHHDFTHLAGNMFAFVLFGYRSCMALGPAAFLGLYLAGAFASSSAHVMHNLYHGRTAPRLTSAELRGVLRNAVRDIDAEARRLDSQQKPSWLPFGVAQASTGGHLSSLLPHASMQMKEGGEEGDGGSNHDVFEKIGRLMAEIGMRIIAFIRRRSDLNDEDGTDERPNRELDRRLEELARETHADEAARERGAELEAIDREAAESKRLSQSKSWRQALEERRQRREREEAASEERRHAALMELAEQLVFHCYVAPRDMPSLGASGAVMAITNGSVLLFPRDLVVKGGINLPLPAAAAMYTFSDIIGVVYPHPVNPVDHAGHLAGAGTGLLYVWFRWTKLCSNAGSLPIVALWRESRRQKK